MLEAKVESSWRCSVAGTVASIWGLGIVEAMVESSLMQAVEEKAVETLVVLVGGSVVSRLEMDSDY